MSRRVATNGIELAITEAGEGYPVVLLHGFPELAYSWRYQLPVLAGAGFHAVAPDLRGYGDSDKPDTIEDYGLLRLVDDVVGLIDALEADKVALVAHDWGAIIGWTAALLHPDRIERLVSLNVPYRGWCSAFPTTSFIKEHLSDRFGYVLMLQEPGVAEAWFASDPAGKLRGFYQGAAVDPDFLSGGRLPGLPRRLHGRDPDRTGQLLPEHRRQPHRHRPPRQCPGHRADLDGRSRF